MRNTIKRTLSLALAICLCLSLCAVQVFADDQSVPVTLNVTAATFDVTVPTSLPITVSADGGITYANNAVIHNGSNGPVKISNIEINAADGWTKDTYSESLSYATTPVNSQRFAMQILNADSLIATSILGGGDSAAISYAAKLPTFSNGLTDETIANVVFTVGWDAVSFITFTINDTEYQAEEGMTWGEWIDSVYNKNDWTTQESYIISSDGLRTIYRNTGYDLTVSDRILSGDIYKVTSNSG